MDQLIQLKRRESIAEIILNRPEKRNAISLEMLDALDQTIADIGRMAGLRVVLIRGEGPVFSSGIDLTTFLQLPDRYGDHWQQHMRTITRHLQSVFDHLEQLELPTIALLRGYCLGLALELALACDIRLAANGTMIGLPESRLGIIPDVGGTTRMTRLVGPARAKELIFTGRQIPAETAANWGLVNDVTGEQNLESRAEELAHEIIEAAPLAVGMAKRVIDQAADLQPGLDLEGWAQSQLVMSEDFAEAIQAFMMKRKPEFKGR